MVESYQNVIGFLAQVNQAIDEGRVQVNNSQWIGKENKTLTFMAERNLKSEDLYNVIKELTPENYCATKPDINQNFKNEEIWEFGITKTFSDEEEDLYIKLKVRTLKGKYLLVMSFHPERPDRVEKKLQFPYMNYNI